MRIFLLPVVLIFAFFGWVSYSDPSKEKAHEHKEGEPEEHEDHEHEEGEEEGHAHGDEHGEHEEEGSPSVGPEKGILAADKHEGFKLSPEAIKNFELKTEKLNGAGPWRLPSSALLLAGEERNLYRLREGFYKRVDFTPLPATGAVMVVTSKDLRADDEIVIQGLGFLRIAELAAFGGAPAGHSH